MSQDQPDLDARLDRLEKQTGRILELLEAQASTRSSPGSEATALDGALQDASTALAQTYGSDPTRARLGEMLTRLGDPETMESLVRIAELAPHLEYAAHFAAAGPALLEEALAAVRAETESSGGQPRPDQVLELVKAVAAPKTLSSLTRLAADLGPIEPTLSAAAQALEARADVEGAGEVEARVAAAVQDLLDPEVLGSLVRIANLTPQIEYAVQFLAAGPELLEEGMDLVRGWSGKNLQGAPLERRVERITSALVAATEPRRLEVFERLLERVDELEPFAIAISQLDGDVMAELIGAISNPETANGLRRLLDLAPTLAAPLEALPIQPRTLDMLRTLNAAVEAASAESNALGAFGLLSALGQPDVKRAAGFGVGVARRLGQHLEEGPALPPGTKNGRSLNGSSD